MTDIELAIKIPKEYYELVLERCKDPVLLNAFKNGTPLPKGHGRLIDADALNFNADYNEPLISKLDFDNAPTIIGADKAESEERNA